MAGPQGTIAGMYGVVNTSDLNGQAVEFNCRNWTIDWTADALDVTTFDSTAGPRAFIGGLTSWSGSFEALLDKDTAIFSSAITVAPVDTLAKFDVGPIPVTSDTIRFNGSILINGFSVSTAVDGLPVVTFTFQGTDTLSHSIPA